MEFIYIGNIKKFFWISNKALGIYFCVGYYLFATDVFAAFLPQIAEFLLLLMWVYLFCFYPSFFDFGAFLIQILIEKCPANANWKVYSLAN